MFTVCGWVPLQQTSIIQSYVKCIGGRLQTGGIAFGCCFGKECIQVVAMCVRKTDVQEIERQQLKGLFFLLLFFVVLSLLPQSQRQCVLQGLCNIN